jgi:YegS/Rv2252/BmrU family lipid kinase
VFLVNPASANGETGRRWAELARRASSLGLRGDTLFSRQPGHLRTLAAEAAAAGATLVVAVGGDGTVNEVAGGLVGAAGVELAILPRGTGVDFARTFGISSRLDDAVRVALEGAAREVDAGSVAFRTWDGGEGAAHFFNVGSAGMSGAVAQRTNESRKALGGRAAYLWATFAVFARWTSGDVRVSVDDQVRGGRMYDVVVANGRYFGGGMMICPDAQPDDGLFDVLLIGDVTRRDLVLTMPRIYRGTHLPHPKAELLRGSAVVVEAADPLPIELDGEQPGTTPVRFDVVRRAIRLRVPRS